MDVKIIPHKDKKGLYTVIPYGAIDTDTHQTFRDKLNDLLEKSPKIILMDLSHVDVISSAGLGVLFSVKKQLILHHGELLFCNLKPQITKLFEIVKTLPKESIFRSIDEADAYFYKVMNEEIKKNQQNEGK